MEDKTYYTNPKIDSLFAVIGGKNVPQLFGMFGFAASRSLDKIGSPNQGWKSLFAQFQLFGMFGFAASRSIDKIGSPNQAS